MQSQTALHQFLDIIRDADNTFLDPEKALDSQGKVDGYSHILHLIQTAIDFYFHNDPLCPQFMLLANENRKLYGDNVDSVYYFSQVQANQEYIIEGQRFDSCYLSFCLYGGDPNGELADRVSLNINHRDIEFDADGKFSIKLTSNPKGKNEFKMDEDSVSLFTREYFVDRFNSRESTLSIRNCNPQPKSLPLSDEELARRIRNLTTFFQCTTWVSPLPVSFPINQFLPAFEFDKDQGGWGTVDNTYCFGRFKLEKNEYLKIHFTSPEACYWGLQTWNFLMQSMDFKNYPVCINMGTATAEADGSYTIYLSEREAPQNWISTAGYKEGIVFCRWLLAEETPETPTIELGKW